MRLARYRPPASLPDVKGPGFPQWLLDQLRSIGDDLAGSGATDVDSVIRQERLDVPSGATRRVSPTASGMAVVLEAPSSDNAGEQIILIVEDPRGTVTVTASPHTGTDGRVTLSLINASRQASFSRSGVVVFYSNGVDGWKTITESPAEAGAIGATGPTGGDGADGATGATGAAGADSAMRRIRREIYYADGSKDTIENGSTVTTTSSVWNVETDGNAYKVWLVAGGTGGNRSRKKQGVVADECGAGGPGGPAVNERTFYRDEIDEYLALLGTDITVTVGAGGGGAAAGTISSPSEAGADGTLGGASAFGDLLAAYPGGLGESSEVTNATFGGGGGGWMSRGQDDPAAAEGGAPWTGTNRRDGDFGGGRGDGGSAGNDAGAGVYGGGGGGGNLSTAGGNGRAAGRSLKGVPGAGAGGSLDTTGPTPRSGGDAGGRGFYTSGGEAPAAQTGGGPAGGAATTGSTGNDGADGADGVLGLMPGESGAGGGALICDASGGTQLGGRGGDGGFPGGSGGSSGCVNKPLVTGQDCAAARGGDGEDGAVVVDTFG